MRMLVDDLEITLKAGKGGNGRVSFFPGKKSGPDGGNGGKGGDIYIKANSNLSNLNHYLGKEQISAENGQDGDRRNKTGAKGEDLELSFPVGTFLIDQDSKEETELIKNDQKILVCIGGKGGKGNTEFKSSIQTTPKFAEKGEAGQIRYFKIILKLIADFGLIGLPNAGKSSLLNELTNSNAKVADYPFTTLEPNLGAINGKVIADIPGLIEGASNGKGLGINFLKHIEKVKLLLHCISSESEDLERDYKAVIKEMGEYNPQIVEKNQIILLTKSDLLDKKGIDKKLKKLSKFQENVIHVSIHDWDSLNQLKSLFAN